MSLKDTSIPLAIPNLRSGGANSFKMMLRSVCVSVNVEDRNTCKFHFGTDQSVSPSTKYAPKATFPLAGNKSTFGGVANIEHIFSISSASLLQ